MENATAWVIPVTFLPGLGLLIMSTSNRFSFLKTQLRSYTPEQLDAFETTELQRVGLLTKALISQYLAVFFFCLGSVLGGITAYVNHNWSVWVLFTLIILGVCCVMFAAFLLIRESLLLHTLIKERFRRRLL